MANLTRTLAIEWASSGVRVNAVAPGFVASSGYDTYEDEPFAELIEDLPRLTLAHRQRHRGRDFGGSGISIVRRGRFHHRAGVARQRRKRSGQWLV